MISSKAVRQQVNIGPIQFEGLMLPDGSFGVTQKQLADLVDLSSNNLVYYIRAAIPKDTNSMVYKFTPEHAITFAQQGFRRSRIALEGQNSKVNIIPLDDVVSILYWLGEKGNTNARGILNLLAGLSLNQLFCDAFGIKFDKDDRQAWLKARLKGKQARRSWTDAVRDHALRHPDHWPNGKPPYGYLTNLTKNWLGFPLVKGHRDICNEQELRIYDLAEGILKNTIDGNDMCPLDAIQQARKLYPALSL